MSDDRLRSVLEPSASGVVVRVRAQPGARRNGVTGLRENELCVAVTAPPDRGRANDAVVCVLAAALGIAKGRVELVSGPTNRHKRFAASGVSLDEATLALRAALP
ncbi:hypothetical protein Pla108_28850 [Botrimarina colliarenosi]|uniref:UPF0235 protein Pla108_28850 n=1 Tax=Botrimarina colliarenosi TaxID=2528001 RepID=A0A5C6A920_9BACT|nr:DUF167 domain-containing protein [Botrimarina colliarenosi]TWT95808.1 hypothetical protein Pla108_28850 [Botrimarina colliarenosi]